MDRPTGGHPNVTADLWLGAASVAVAGPGPEAGTAQPTEQTAKAPGVSAVQSAEASVPAPPGQGSAATDVTGSTSTGQPHPSAPGPDAAADPSPTAVAQSITGAHAITAAPQGPTGPAAALVTTRPLLQLRPGDPAAIGSYTVLRRIPGFHLSDVFLVSGPKAQLLVLKLSGTAEIADPQRITREAAYLSRVRSSRVAKVVDSGVWEHRAYFVQEFIDGPTFADVLRSGEQPASPLPEPDAYRLARGLAEALRDVHRADVVHRDVKPSNIILSTTRGVVLVDFGIARTEQDDRITRLGATLGTPRYMSPEQVAGAAVRETSDVFQWGLVVGEALLGRHPLRGIDDHGTAAVSRCAVDPALDGNLGRLVADTLQPNPQHRPSLGQILAELDRTEVLPGPDATTTIPLPDRKLSDLRTPQELQDYLAPRADHALRVLADRIGVFTAAIATAALLGWLIGFLVGAVVATPGGGA